MLLHCRSSFQILWLQKVVACLASTVSSFYCCILHKEQYVVLKWIKTCNLMVPELPHVHLHYNYFSWIGFIFVVFSAFFLFLSFINWTFCAENGTKNFCPNILSGKSFSAFLIKGLVLPLCLHQMIMIQICNASLNCARLYCNVKHPYWLRQNYLCESWYRPLISMNIKTLLSEEAHKSSAPSANKVRTASNMRQI